MSRLQRTARKPEESGFRDNNESVKRTAEGAGFSNGISEVLFCTAAGFPAADIPRYVHGEEASAPLPGSFRRIASRSAPPRRCTIIDEIV